MIGTLAQIWSAFFIYSLSERSQAVAVQKEEERFLLSRSAFTEQSLLVRDDQTGIWSLRINVTNSGQASARPLRVRLELGGIGIEPQEVSFPPAFKVEEPVKLVVSGRGPSTCWRYLYVATAEAGLLPDEGVAVIASFRAQSGADSDLQAAPELHPVSGTVWGPYKSGQGMTGQLDSTLLQRFVPALSVRSDTGSLTESKGSSTRACG